MQIVELLSTDRLFSVVAAIRRQVFIVEQSVPAHLEWDEDDQKARHFLLCINGRPVSTARLVGGRRITRMCTRRRYRRQMAGSTLLRHLIKTARTDDAGRELSLHAQVDSLSFYSRHGFRPVGERFEEAGILHQKMVLDQV